AFGAGAQGEGPRRVGDDVADEILPLLLEAVLVDHGVGHLVPRLVEDDRLRDIGVPHGARRADAVLRPAALQTGDGRAVRAVDLEGDEVVAPHPYRPGRIDVRDDA